MKTHHEIHVSPIPNKVGTDEIHEYFQQFGTIDKIFLKKSTKKGIPSKYAFIRFKDAKAQEIALEANGANVWGVEIEINPARGSLKKSDESLSRQEMWFEKRKELGGVKAELEEAKDKIKKLEENVSESALREERLEERLRKALDEVDRVIVERDVALKKLDDANAELMKSRPLSFGRGAQRGSRGRGGRSRRARRTRVFIAE